LDPTGRESARITLEQVYVGLDAVPSQAITFERQAGETRSVLAVAASQPRLIILGDPGSGKSTFLRFLALRLAQARLAPESDWLSYLSWPVYPVEQRQEAKLRREKADESLGQASWPHPPYVPLLITLRDFAVTDFDPTSPMALWRFIETDLAERGLAETTEAVRQAFCRGEGIFLLDGVDEVPLDRRPQVWQAIGKLAKSGFNQCSWLTTCRILSFVEKEAAVTGATGKVTLAPLSQPQIEEFVKGWYEALVHEGQVTQHKGRSLSSQLSRAATSQPRLRELAENPMLLTIMALVQTYYGTLPQERAKLYQACVETLLLRWQQSKEAEAEELPAELAELELKQEVIERLLWEIGWVAHAEQTAQEAADISEQQVIEIARRHLGSYATAEAFVEYTERRAHLLIGKGGKDDRRYSFPHRTFQEYLAGCHLANDRRFGRKATPLAEAGAPW
jgi:predicted NACHT family NTPase